MPGAAAAFMPASVTRRNARMPAPAAVPVTAAPRPAVPPRPTPTGAANNAALLMTRAAPPPRPNPAAL